MRNVRSTGTASAAGIALKHEGEHACCVALLNALQREDYRFTTVSPATHALVNRRAGHDTAADLRGIFGWSRRFDAATIDSDLLRLMQSAAILVREGPLWRSTIRVSSIGSQLFMHSAFPTLREDSVFFGPDTYRFINALERHIATRDNAVERAVDIGCGAGPGAISIARAFPTADVFAVDINASALRMTAINAAAAQAGNVQTLHGNLLTDIDGLFDLVIANPPYMVDAGGRTYRHGGGTLGEGLSVDIVRAALSRLAPGGTLMLYTGVAMVDGFDCFLAAIQPLLASSGYRWSYQELDPDIFPEELATPAYRHAERIAAVLLEVAKT